MRHEDFERANRAVANKLHLVEDQELLIARLKRIHEDPTKERRQLKVLKSDLRHSAKERDRVIVEIRKEERSVAELRRAETPSSS
jgi:hypothetical protein